MFFTNSGSEANESAIKVARKWAGSDRRVIVSALGSFHGRTYGSLSATGQLAKHKGFEPVVPGFVHVAYDDLGALETACDSGGVAAVILESIQGEAGVIEPSAGYLTGVRRLCDDRGILLIVDEVQTGLGRTGRWFGFNQSGIAPDVVTVSRRRSETGCRSEPAGQGPRSQRRSVPVTTERRSGASRSQPPPRPQPSPSCRRSTPPRLRQRPGRGCGPGSRSSEAWSPSAGRDC